MVGFTAMLDKLESGEWEGATTEGWTEDRGEYITLSDDAWEKRLVFNAPLDSVKESPFSITSDTIFRVTFIQKRF